MYTADDLRLARSALRRAGLILTLPLVLLLCGYVAAILAGSRAWMLALLLAGFAWIIFESDLLLLPAHRYLRFLRDMQQGLRRSARCRLLELKSDVELQDGVRVYALQVALLEGGDSRIFYINTNKAALLPPMGADVQLESYGRHVVNCGMVER